MKNKITILSTLFLGAIMLADPGSLSAQEAKLSLQEAFQKALQNNKSYHIKILQADEKRAKVKEDKFMAYPNVALNSTYQYNASVGELVIPEGTLGALPTSSGTVALPNTNLNFALGESNAFNAGVGIYQPISELKKIKTAVSISKTAVDIAEMEKAKVSIQIRQAVEKLYYGLLINRKQQEEASVKMKLAGVRIYDVESGKLSGKTIEANEAGRKANVADEEQQLLKLQIQQEDYLNDLSLLIGMPIREDQLADISVSSFERTNMLEEYKTQGFEGNVDLKLAGLEKKQSELALNVAKLGVRPDLGMIAGYSFQKGNAIFPQNNPYVGVSLKWNLTKVLSNKQAVKQRYLVSQQAQLSLADKNEQLENDIEKAYRKIRQAEALINVAKRSVDYRREEMKVQQDKSIAGLNTQADLLTTQALLAGSEIMLYSAQLSYLLAISEMKILTGEF